MVLGSGACDAGQVNPGPFGLAPSTETDGGSTGAGSTTAPDNTSATTGAESETSSNDGGTGGSTGSEASGEDLATGCWDIGAWQASEAFSGLSHPLPSFAVGSWFYVHTEDDGGGRILLSAQAKPDGGLGPWQQASPDHGGGPHGYSAIAVGDDAFHFRNGHIARYVLTDDGKMMGDVELLEDDVTEAFDGQRYVWDSPVAISDGAGPIAVVHLGGYSFSSGSYRSLVTRSGVPMGPRFTTAGPEHPADRPGHAAYVRTRPDGTGFVFMRDGAEGSTLWSAAVDASAEVSTWSQAADLPAGSDNERGDLFVRGRTVFAVLGTIVVGSDVADDGTVGPWVQMPQLPEPQINVHWGEGHLEGNAWGIIGDHAYVTGPSRVFYAPLVGRSCN